MSNSGWPQGLHVFERGWLSSNNILLVGEQGCALVDSGYWTHSAQTVQLVAQTLGGRRLDLLINTHLHSDHCGGNAALAEAYPLLDIRIPAPEEASVRDWNEDLLSFKATGQGCPRFEHRSTFKAGDVIRLGCTAWETHSAPGHDSNAVLLFEPSSKTLISADALWESGFGVVFPELTGEPSFDDVARTLDLIEALSPAVIIPGHGRPFTELAPALRVARRRLDGYAAQPILHARHALKVLMKFKLMELGSASQGEFLGWFAEVPLVLSVTQKHFSGLSAFDVSAQLLDELHSKGHVALESNTVFNCT